MSTSAARRSALLFAAMYRACAVLAAYREVLTSSWITMPSRACTLYLNSVASTRQAAESTAFDAKALLHCNGLTGTTGIETGTMVNNGGSAAYGTGIGNTNTYDSPINPITGPFRAHLGDAWSTASTSNAGITQCQINFGYKAGAALGGSVDLISAVLAQHGLIPAAA